MATSPVPNSTRLVSRSDLGAWLRALAGERAVLAPVAVGGKTMFRELEAGQEDVVDLETVRTVDSPKGALLPQTEPLLTYAAGKGEDGAATLKVAPAPSSRPAVLFGVRPCDAAALELLDKVFLTGDFVDEQYRARREATTVVAVACPAPARTCFCTSFGLSPGSERGADIVLYGRSGPERKSEPEAYYAVAYTERGEALLAGSPASAVTEVPAGEDGRLEETILAFRSLSTPLGERLGRVDVAPRLDGLFEHPVWEKLAAPCLGCGTCTFVCPTCYCFGVADCGAGGKGVRFRYWDSCKFPQFLLMAAGHNPRPAKRARTRQRFMHKLNYYHHRYGEYLCVGCGRCVDACPVGLHLPLVVGEVRGL